MRLVTTLTADSLEGMAQQARSAASPWVEARLDLLHDAKPEDLVALHGALRKPAIATCRSKRQGGGFAGTEEEREAWLRAALAAGFEALDLETDARFLRRLAEEAARKGAEVIVSRHDFDAPQADAARLLSVLPAGAIAKYVAQVRGPGDLALLLRIAARFREAGVRFAVMGIGDASLRLMAPLLGSELVYCAPTEGQAAAAGQLPAEVVAKAHATLPQVSAASAAQRLVLLLGDPVAHSASPAMQNAAFLAQGDPLHYAAARVRKADLPAAVEGLRALGAAGANVTLPHKEAIGRFLDSVSPEARRARSVNTIVARQGKLAGHTTDGAGALDALRAAGVEVRGTRVLLLGAGGAGRAVAHALHAAGAELCLANRTPAKARALAREVQAEPVAWSKAALTEAAGDAGLLVNCTILGLADQRSPLPPRALHEKLVVLDAVYKHGGTPLVRAARQRDCLTVPGEAMLLHQGARAYTLWTGKPAPIGIMRQALLRALEEP